MVERRSAAAKAPEKRPRESRLGLKLLALLFSVILWAFGYIGRGEVGQRVVKASVTYVRPGSMFLLEEVSQVEVRLTGRKATLATLDPTKVTVQIDLRTAKAGPHQVELQPEDVLAPRSVKVASINPSTLQLELDALEEVELPVRVLYAGEPAAGARVIEARADPQRVTAIGPRTVLEKHSFMPTEPIDLNTHALTFEETVAVRPPSQLINTRPLRVRVRVTMEPPSTPPPPSG